MPQISGKSIEGLDDIPQYQAANEISKNGKYVLRLMNDTD